MSRYDETLDLVAKTFMVWSFEASNPDFNPIIEEAHEQSFICNVLNKRVEAFNLPIIIPDYMSIILETCTGANPGQSLLLAYLVVEKAHTENATLDNKYVITPTDFSNVFCFEFPITIDNLKLSKKYEEMWDNQKILDAKFPQSDNLIDTPEHWMKAVKGE